MSWVPTRCCSEAGLSLRTPLLGALALCMAAAVQADVLRHCAAPPPLDAAQQDRLFRFAALVRDALQQSGARVALIARAGLDLRRFDQR